MPDKMQGDLKLISQRIKLADDFVSFLEEISSTDEEPV